MSQLNRVVLNEHVLAHKRGRVMKTRDFTALRPWRRVKYLFSHDCEQIRDKHLHDKGRGPETVVDLSTEAEPARLSVSR